MSFIRSILLSTVLLGIQTGSLAVEPEIEKDISNALRVIFPELQITSIKETQLNDLYEILLGVELSYISRDGRYLF